MHQLVYEASDPALADRVLGFFINDSRVAFTYAGVRNQVEATRSAVESHALWADVVL